MKLFILIIIISFAFGFLKYENGNLIFSTEKMKKVISSIANGTEEKLKSSGIIEKTKNEFEKAKDKLNKN